jgi:hypothetical protein
VREIVRTPDIALRAAAALAGVAVLPFALVAAMAALAAAAFAAQAPDAFGIRGDPCCAPPQTWSEVWLGALVAVPLVALAALLCTALASFATTVFTERGLTRRTIVRAPLGPIVVLAGVVPFGWLVDEPHLRASCDGFAVVAADWRADERARWRSAEAIDRCGALHGRRPADVRRLLGEPDLRRDRLWIYFGAAGYDADSTANHLNVAFRGGRVSSARLAG